MIGVITNELLLKLLYFLCDLSGLRPNFLQSLDLQCDLLALGGSNAEYEPMLDLQLLINALMLLLSLNLLMELKDLLIDILQVLNGLLVKRHLVQEVVGQVIFDHLSSL